MPKVEVLTVPQCCMLTINSATPFQSAGRQAHPHTPKMVTGAKKRCCAARQASVKPRLPPYDRMRKRRSRPGARGKPSAQWDPEPCEQFSDVCKGALSIRE